MLGFSGNIFFHSFSLQPLLKKKSETGQMRHSGAEIDPVATFLLHFPKQILYIAIILALEHKYIQTFIRINNHEDPLCTISSFRRNSTVTNHVKKNCRQKYTLWYWQYWNFRNCSEISDFWFSLKKWLKYQQCDPSQNPTNHPKNLILTYQFCCTKMKQF